MILHAHFGRGPRSPHSNALWKNMYSEIRWMRKCTIEILEHIHILLKKPKPLLRDNKYVEDRLGVSDRTVRRFIEKGELEIYETINKWNYYLDEDVQALFRKYRGTR